MKITVHALILACGLSWPTAWGADTIDPKPTPDLRTPEGAMRSYWAVLDWYERAGSRSPRDPVEEQFEHLMAAVTLGETREFWVKRAQSGRRPARAITRAMSSVTRETRTRTVILANVKNVSPIPAGARPTPFLIQYREKGEDYKYVLELQGKEWGVTEVWKSYDALKTTTRQYKPDEFFPWYPADVPPQ